MKLQTALMNARNSVRIITLGIMFTAVTISTADGFAQSYAGLYRWALAHKLDGWKAESFPLLVDLFIIVGELGLFLLALDGILRFKKDLISWTDIFLPFTVAAVGWSVSLWFNIGDESYTRDDQITHAVPPIAAMVGLMILLRTVHRYAARLESASNVPPVAPELEPVPAPVPTPVRTTIVRVPATFSAGTQTRTVWPVLAPVPARTSDHGTVPALEAVKPVHTANGNGVLSEPSQNRAVPEYVHNGFVMDSPETAAETRKAVPVREPSGVPASPTAANSEPHTEPPTTDERFAKGLKYVMEFHAVTGKLPGQRPVAAHLDMRNRQLAASILTHAKEMINDGQIKNGVPEAANPAG